LLPLLPVATLVFGLGLLEVTSEPPIGFVTLHEMLILHVLAPDGMVQDEGESESVPEGAAVWHELPFHDVPDAQLAVAVLLASSWLLL
jgi:hypothetical protein